MCLPEEVVGCRKNDCTNDIEKNAIMERKTIAVDRRLRRDNDDDDDEDDRMLTALSQSELLL